MVQVDRNTFEGLRGAAGEARRGGSLSRALRLSEIPRPVLAAVVVLAIAAVALGAVLLGRLDGGELVVRGQGGASFEADAAAGAQPPEDPGGTSASDADGAASPEEPPLQVHVAGAVAHPGLYALPAGSRVHDAVVAAGGLGPDADVDALNLAEPLVDGCKVNVPHVGQTSFAGEATVELAGGAGGAAARAINVNTATVEQLQDLPGVGEATAAAIVEDRRVNGPFASPEDLMRVSGIGEKKFERMRAQVVV